MCRTMTSGRVALGKGHTTTIPPPPPSPPPPSILREIFNDIAAIVEATLAKEVNGTLATIDAVFDVDQRARQHDAQINAVSREFHGRSLLQYILWRCVLSLIVILMNYL